VIGIHIFHSKRCGRPEVVPSEIYAGSRCPADPANRELYNRGSMKATKPLTINSIDVDNDKELDALMAEVLAEGDKIYEAQYQEALRWA
jgi:hypothetical protein